MARGFRLSAAGLSGALLAGGLALLAVPARAGSVTAESIFDRQATRQQARSQVPKGATVTRTVCEDLEVGLDNTRYRCTVYYTMTPAPTPTPAATPAPSAPATGQP
ncbi:hypothetical protein [Synechococcus sp. CCAP 1479/13]|nr:hypothetical protein [Synechococcus sp. CCAP 1479/13]